MQTHQVTDISENPICFNSSCYGNSHNHQTHLRDETVLEKGEKVPTGSLNFEGMKGSGDWRIVLPALDHWPPGSPLSTAEPETSAEGLETPEVRIICGVWSESFSESLLTE